jgi:EipB-like
MRVLMGLLPAGVLLLAQSAWGQMQPHRAEYTLRLGGAVNAPRVGTATQDLTLDCDGWHLKRDVKGEVPISATWKFNVASSLDSDEARSGDDLRYRSLQVQNGAEREVHGKVQRAAGELRAEINSPDGAAHVPLPALTRMPVASIDYIIGQLRAGALSFTTLTFDAQGIGDAFRVDVTQIEERALRRRLPLDKPLVVSGRSWPVLLSFTRDAKDQHKPLFVFSARLYETGVLDHVTVDADVVTITADLGTLEMRPSPTCR